jgi:hypothetical protein
LKSIIGTVLKTVRTRELLGRSQLVMRGRNKIRVARTDCQLMGIQNPTRYLLLDRVIERDIPPFHAMGLCRLEQAIGKVHDARVSEQNIVNDGPIPDGVEFWIVRYFTVVIDVPFSDRRQEIHRDTVAAAIIVGFAMQRLMGVTHQMNNESKGICDCLTGTEEGIAGFYERLAQGERGCRRPRLSQPSNVLAEFSGSSRCSGFD